MEMVLKGHQAAFHLLRAFFPAGELLQHRGQVKRPIRSRRPTAALGSGHWTGVRRVFLLGSALSAQWVFMAGTDSWSWLAPVVRCKETLCALLKLFLC